LLNRLCAADVLVEDKLFATLDPRVRKTDLVPGRSVLVSDTVGFIRHLPHDLVPAFAATLEAVRTADLLVHVVDLSRPTWRQDARVVLDTLESEVFDQEERRPSILTVLNKLDCCVDTDTVDMDGVLISARWGTNVDELRRTLSERLFPTSVRVRFRLPHAAIHVLHPAVAAGRASVMHYDGHGAVVEADLSQAEWAGLCALGAEPTSSDACPDEER
jgi:GTP-binding protein HflX